MGSRLTGSLFDRARHRLVSMWAQRLGETVFGTVRPSMIANFAVTSRCTFRCRSCTIGREFREDPSRAATDLALDEIVAILDRDRDALKYVSWIQLTGGEPFLRDDLDRIVMAFHDRLPNCAFWLATNGGQPDKIEAAVRSMMEAGVNRLGVGVSVHGDEQRHDAYSGEQHAHKHAMETLRGLVGLRETHGPFRVAAGFTITPDNLDCLVSTYDAVRAAGAEFTCRLPNSSDIYYGYSAPDAYSPGFLAALDSQLDLLERRMGFRKVSANPLNVLRRRYYRGIREYARNPARIQLPCRAGATSVFITPKGVVYPCLFVPTPMGDLRERSLLDILNSPENAALRKAIHAGECPNCWVECETYRVLNENVSRVLASGLREAAGVLARDWLDHGASHAGGSSAAVRERRCRSIVVSSRRG